MFTGPLSLLALAALLPQQPPQAPLNLPPPAPDSMLHFVQQSILNQPLSQHSLSVLNIPDPFLTRVADRIIRESFEQNFRIILDNSSPIAPASSPVLSPPASAPAAPPSPRVSTRVLWPTILLPVLLVIILARRKRKKNTPAP